MTTKEVNIHLERELWRTLVHFSLARQESFNTLVNRLLHAGLDKELAETGYDREEQLRNDPVIAELIKNYHPDLDEMLPNGITLREYENLSDEEEAALWDEEFQKELDKDEGIELDLPPTVETSRQRRSEALFKRIEKLYPRKKDYHGTRGSD